MRRLDISQALAKGLGQLQAIARERRGVPTRCRAYVRERDIEELERTFDVDIPDSVIAYLAAGVSAWREGAVDIRNIDERTQAVRETAEESGVPAEARDFLVIDEDSTGNFIAVRRGEAPTSDRVYFLDHERSWAAEGDGMSLTEHITRLVAREQPLDFTPFSAELGEDPSEGASQTLVSHPRFGRGKVVKRMGENVIVSFEGLGEKRLKRAYLRFE